MTEENQVKMIRNWLNIYGFEGIGVPGSGITDGPTRGLMVELLFWQLMSERVRQHLCKGTFEIEPHQTEIHKKPDGGVRPGRKSKYQYDWLLLKKAPIIGMVKSYFEVNSVPFKFVVTNDRDDVACVIELKSASPQPLKKRYDSIVKEQDSRARPDGVGVQLKWVYVSVTGSSGFQKIYVPSTHGIFFSLLEGNEKEEEKPEAIYRRAKPVDEYLASFLKT